MLARKTKPLGIFDLMELAKKTNWPSNLRLPLPPAKPGETVLGRVPANVHGMLYLSMLYEKKVEELMVEARWAADEDQRQAIVAEISEKTTLGKQLMDMLWTETRANLANGDKSVPDNMALRQDMIVVESSGCGAEMVTDMLKEMFGEEVSGEVLGRAFSRGRTRAHA